MNEKLKSKPYGYNDNSEGATPDKPTPEQRAIVALDDAVAKVYFARLELDNTIDDAFRRGEQEGRAKVLQLLRLIIDAPSKNNRLAMIKNAEKELAKWGV